MKIFLIISTIITLLISSFAQDNKKEVIHNLILTPKTNLSEKEKAYQKEMKRLEEENKKLEENGFCSCNNS